MNSLLTLVFGVLLSYTPMIYLFTFTKILPWLIAVPLVGIIVIFFRRSKRTYSPILEETRQTEAKPDCKEVVEFTRYAGGHPDIHEPILPCVVHVKPQIFEICKYINDIKTQVICVGMIPIESIIEIRVEDVFTMKRKITPENWKHSLKYFEDLNDSKGDEIAFIVIEWIRDTEHMFTYFCIVNELAMEIAVKKRNAILKKARQATLQLA
jgi:hypothetical protein